VVWVYFSFNVITDMYLLSIPLPMLWKSSLRPVKKVGLMILFGGGILVIACATLRCVLIVTVRQHHSIPSIYCLTNDQPIQDPVNGAQLAGSWAVRETFVAVVTTNLPMVYPLLTIIFGPCIGSFLSSMRSTNKHGDMARGSKSLASYGDNTGYSSKGPRSNPMTNVTFSESEERIVGVIELNDMKDRSESGSSNTIDRSRGGFNTDIQKDVEVNVVCQSRDGNELALDQQRQQATASLEEGMRRQQQGNYAFARGPSQRHAGDAV
jgi:hypothetical protein